MCLGFKKSCNLASMLQLQRALNNDMQPGDFIQNGGAPLARGRASSILCPSLTHQVSLRFHLVRVWTSDVPDLKAILADSPLEAQSRSQSLPQRRELQGPVAIG